MAAASPLTISPSERKVPFGIAKSPRWPPLPSVTMHVTRPKSAKGRTRSNLSYSQSLGTYSYQVPSSPQPVATPGEEAVSGRRAASSQPIQAFPAEVPDLLQQVPTRTSSSLNKYRVLPSISRKERRMGTAEVMFEQAGQLPASADEEEEGPQEPPLPKGSTSLLLEHKGGGGEYPQPPFTPLERPQLNKKREGLSPTTLALNLEEPCEEPRLLLAIRSPSGERFERYFRPTDNLGTVVAVAEQKNAATYRRCSIRTVEVPRRTFSDLSRSLQDCAIHHKSVLCILLDEQQGEL
ncbi:UBX domain-containing protein 10 [Pantherophis guttatus]|uniref:UBX domain-containing protein 10 n=1 Tax=Pantherophis guttatus TaxID=94885 RepID=A0A6P9CBN4_PANGU|nr:UBX domain-containing protein 10 [Pantherophis guttatus]XP_034280174.1 UBX domain-containing protein 10 [Pantherophis guttatus]